MDGAAWSRGTAGVTRMLVAPPHRVGRELIYIGVKECWQQVPKSHRKPKNKSSFLLHIPQFCLTLTGGRLILKYLTRCSEQQTELLLAPH